MADLDTVAYQAALDHIREVFPNLELISRAKAARYLNIDPYAIMHKTKWLKYSLPKGQKYGHTRVSPESLALIKIGY